MTEDIKIDAPKGLKALVGKKISKKIKFMGSEIEIVKLTVAQVLEIQKSAKETKEDSEEGLDVLKLVFRLACAEAGELSDEDFLEFPIDELSKVSAEIMKFSGMDANTAGK